MKTRQNRKQKRNDSQIRTTHTKGVQIFDLMHPAVLFGYFGVILVFSMLAIHPLYLALSFGAAFFLSIYLRGWRASFKTLAWQLPLVVLITFINPVFSSMGTTELFRIGLKAVHAEELVFGGCMGLMLVSVMLWFMNLTYVMPSEKMMSLFGGKAPMLSFMFTALMRQIPQFLKRSKQIDSSMKACTAAMSSTNRDIFSSRVRLTSVLMAWSMEDSLEMADAMKARGWASLSRRSSYRRYCFKQRDALALTVLFLFTVISVLLVWNELVMFQFYPEISPIVFQPGFLAFGILVMLPLGAAMADKLRWRR